MVKRAIVLFNLGGPDTPTAIEPFLYNLFSDPAIIDLPRILRVPIAKVISKRRVKVAEKIYSYLGGKSPILDFTWEQASELEISLRNFYTEDEVRVFLCMRYWHPMSSKTVMEVKDYNPDEILLLPLYPQFSTTTTGSSLDDWIKVASTLGLQKPTYSICCYPTDNKWVEAQSNLLMEVLDGLPDTKNVKILFSAHGLPQKVVNRGDPYQWQVEQSAQAIAAHAKIPIDSWNICYQSRVGPMKWIGPSIDIALKQAAEIRKAVVVLPIAFVSEHSETLVELDIEYKNLANDLGIHVYHRVPALGTHQIFIEGLRDLAIAAFQQKISIGPGGKLKGCTAVFSQCPCQV